jgi:hypothetical protein
MALVTCYIPGIFHKAGSLQHSKIHYLTTPKTLPLLGAYKWSRPCRVKDGSTEDALGLSTNVTSSSRCRLRPAEVAFACRSAGNGEPLFLHGPSHSRLWQGRLRTSLLTRSEVSCRSGSYVQTWLTLAG